MRSLPMIFVLVACARAGAQPLPSSLAGESSATGPALSAPAVSTEIDISTVTISGKILVNGEVVPDVQPGRETWHLQLEDLSTHTSFFAVINGGQTAFATKVPRGKYKVTGSFYAFACNADENKAVDFNVPCGNFLVAPALDATSDAIVNIDLHMTKISVNVKLDGAAHPKVDGLDFVNDTTGERFTFTDQTVSPFSGWLFPGSYTISINPGWNALAAGGLAYGAYQNVGKIVVPSTQGP